MTLQLLRCEACGGSQPLTRAAQRDGWYRCHYCETPHATPVSPFEVYEGPDSAIVLLSRPGRHEFVVPAGILLGTRGFVAGLFISWTLAAMFGGIFQLNPPDHPLHRFGFPLLMVGVAIATGLLLRARFTTQHIVLHRHFVETFRMFWGHRWRLLRFGYPESGTPSVEVLREEDTGSGDVRHLLEVGGSEGATERLRCSGPREAQWLAAMIGHGARDGEDSHVTRCSGCGAPLGVRLEERGVGRLRCQYCDAGFAIDAKGMQPGPVRLPGTKAGYDLDPHFVRTRSSDGGVDFELLPGQAGARWFFGGGLAANTVFWGGFTWVMVGWLAPDAIAHDVPLTFVTWMILGGVMFAFLSVFAAIASANVLWGTERVRLSEGAVEHAWLLLGRPVPRWLQLGGWKTYRRLLTDQEERKRVSVFVGFTHALRRSIALMRLTEVRFSADERGTVAELVSPARTLRLDWSLPDYSDQWLRHQLVEGIRARLEDLGRAVERV